MRFVNLLLCVGTLELVACAELKSSQTSGHIYIWVRVAGKREVKQKATLAV